MGKHHLNPTTIIEVPNIPQGIDIKYTPKFTAQQMLGRQTPLYQYSGASGVSYTFNVELHEDIHVKPGETLNTLINDIKSLSAPRMRAGGYVGGYPEVFFTLGDLSAFVKVETDITWKKPMRQGKYIMAQVNFVLDVVEETPILKEFWHTEEVGQQIEGLEDLYYSDEMRFLTTSERGYHDNLTSSYGSLIGYNVNRYDGEGRTTASKTWDATQQKMIDLFGIYREDDDLKEILDGNTTLKTMFDEGVREMPKSSKDYNKFKKDLLELRKTTHKTVADTYRKEVSETMTRAEMQQVIRYVDSLIDTLLDIASGVMGYGAAY